MIMVIDPRHNHLYVVVDVIDKDSVENVYRGTLLFWDWHGWYYTIQVLDHKTMKVKPILNIVWLKKLSIQEHLCLNENKRVDECLNGNEIIALAKKHLENARKNGFPHLTEQDIQEIIERIKKAFER